MIFEILRLVHRAFQGKISYFWFLASRYRRGSKFGGLLVSNKEILTVRHLVVPTASGIYPEGKGKGNPKIIPRKHTANLERKQRGKFYLLQGTQKLADPEPM